MNVSKTEQAHPNQAAEPTSATNTRPTLTPHGTVMHFRRHRVLIMHGDQEIRTLIAISLRLEGFDVTTAASGQDCLYKIRATVPEILVTTSVNIHEPSECGMVSQLRRYLANSWVKVLLINSASEHSEDWVVGPGISACLTMPFDPAEMIRTVRNMAGTDRVLALGPLLAQRSLRHESRDTQKRLFFGSPPHV